MECIPPKQPIRVWDSQFIRKYLSLRCYSKKSLKTFARLKYGLWKVWNYERGNFFGKSIFRLGKMLTSVKIEHLNSSIKNSEFRFRLIAVPFVKNSKIQERRNLNRLLSKMARTWLLSIKLAYCMLHTDAIFEVFELYDSYLTKGIWIPMLMINWP